MRGSRLGATQPARQPPIGGFAWVVEEQLVRWAARWFGLQRRKEADVRLHRHHGQRQRGMHLHWVSTIRRVCDLPQPHQCGTRRAAILLWKLRTHEERHLHPQALPRECEQLAQQQPLWRGERQPGAVVRCQWEQLCQPRQRAERERQLVRILRRRLGTSGVEERRRGPCRVLLLHHVPQRRDKHLGMRKREHPVRLACQRPA